MQPSGGVHGPPKWKHAPAPPDRHVKYAAAPAWNTQVVVGQPRSGGSAAAALPGPGAALPRPAAAALPAPTGPPSGTGPPPCLTSVGLPPHAAAAITIATMQRGNTPAI